MRILFLCLFLITITNCVSTHQSYLEVQPGWTKTKILEHFGNPDNKTYDDDFTYWIYESTTQKPKRKWLIKYAFDKDEVVEVRPEKMPTASEIQKIKDKAAQKLMKSEKNKPQSQPNESNSFKKL